MNGEGWRVDVNNPWLILMYKIINNNILEKFLGKVVLSQWSLL